MKLFRTNIALILTLVIFVSCADNSTDEDTGSATSEKTVTPEGVTATIPEFLVDGDDVTSRSTMTFDNTSHEFDFSWEEGEVITVYGDAGNKGDFTLTKGSGSREGRFDGGGFTLTANKDYYSICKSSVGFGTNNSLHNIPYINGSFKNFNADQYTNLKMSYEGQRQTVNGDPNYTGYEHATDSLGKYDYMTAVAQAGENNSCNFLYHRLGCIMRVRMTGLPVGVEYTKFMMYDANEDKFRETARTANITNTTSATEYTPYLNDVDLTSSSVRFTLALGPKDGEGITIPADGELIVYMMIPPTDLSNKTIVFRLTPKDGQNVKPWYATYTRTTPFVANTVYAIKRATKQSSQFTFNIKLMQDWDKGDVVSQSRATGDPGNLTAKDLPTHVYVFFMNNGRLVQKAEATPSSSDWTTADGVSSLNSNITWTCNDGSTKNELTLDNSATNPRIYVIASPVAISDWYYDNNGTKTAVTLAYGTTVGTTEEVIQKLVYQYSASGEITSEANLKGLFTTPYSSSDFVGAIKAYNGVYDDVKDVLLYHVASKVDINWESTSALSGSVSLNNIPTANLYYFKPTANAAGTSSVSASITTGTAYNGRAVWYVPQITGGTYNVTVGSKTQDIQFTPDDTFTSWFRGLVTVK